MKNLFIDTNILLDFYHYSNEDIDKLKALESLIFETNEIKIFSSNQNKFEFNRNRESKIQSAIKLFEGKNSPLKVPVLFKNYAKTDELKEAYNKFIAIKKALIIKLKQDAISQKLKADAIIFKILNADSIETTEEIYKRADTRYKIGNPPGKKNSLGDAIHWEFLLENVPEGEDLFFIGGDSDFTSPLDRNTFSDFLLKEWNSINNSNIHFYKSLNMFFRNNYPNIQLIDSLKAEKLIDDLGTAGSFNASREIIKELKNYPDFTKEQVNRLIKSAISNNQVFNAHTYSPNIVGVPLFDIFKPFKDDLEEDDRKEFLRLFK